MSNPDSMVRFALGVIGQEETPLNAEFFSRANMDRLQRAMQETVLHETGLRLSRQSDEALAIIMRSVYVDHARNEAGNIGEQVFALNERVLDICVPQVMSGIRTYLAYIRDVSRYPVPLARAENPSVTGTKVLERSPGL